MFAISAKEQKKQETHKIMGVPLHAFISCLFSERAGEQRHQ
jgi:hypothetical protein